MSKPWRIVVAILVLTFIVNVGVTYLTVVFPQLWPPLPGY